MSKTLILGAIAPIGGILRENTAVLTDGKTILDTDYKGAIPKDTEVIRAEGKYLLPAFIEMHAHGGGGADFADMTKDAFDTVMRTHLSHGVTAICPTTASTIWFTVSTIDSVRADAADTAATSGVACTETPIASGAATWTGAACRTTTFSDSSVASAA